MLEKYDTITWWFTPPKKIEVSKTCSLKTTREKQMVFSEECIIFLRGAGGQELEDRSWRTGAGVQELEDRSWRTRAGGQELEDRS